jgi:phenylacetaldehyde dehydrogenase
MPLDRGPGELAMSQATTPAKHPTTVGNTLMLIDGRRVSALSGQTIDVRDPNSGELLGTSPAADAADVDRAVEAASRTFSNGVWRSLHPSERAKVLWRAADLVDAHAAELAELEALNSGMLLQLAHGVVSEVAEYLRYYAGWATKIHGVTSEISRPSMQFHAFTLKEPIGVCGFIVPWNFPLSLAAIKLAPALAAGCSCVLKPSEETPFTALRLAELLHEAGLPDGVVNVVTGYGHTAGAAIAAHEKIAKVAFTGSTQVGKLIVAAAAGNLKKLTLELGGKSPVIVFDDCDINTAIGGVSLGIFVRSGQVCVAGSRLYVQRGSFDKVVCGITDFARNLKIGNCLDPGTQIGPLISDKQLRRVTNLIASGIDEGAELVTGGKRVGDKGYFVQPTILANPRPSARVVREEIFGPVLTVTPFDDLDDIAQVANDTTYGLASAIWTRDISKAHLLAQKLQAGFVWVNCQFASDPSLPAGGYKQSGWGRELGKEGLDAYLETKSVFISLS